MTAICLIFVAATLACHSSSPLRAACVMVGGSGGFELHKQSTIGNKTEFDYRLITGYCTFDYQLWKKFGGSILIIS